MSLKNSVLAASSMIVLLASGPLLAEGTSRDNFRERGWHQRQQEKKRFELGVCVGQALAQQGILLPAPQPGPEAVLDAESLTAIQTAAQNCFAQMKGDPAPQSSPLPSISSSPTPSTE